MPLKFRNWKRFQHYQNRTPPWIKLHRVLLTDPDFHAMPDRSAKYLPLGWITASENSGMLPDCKRLAFILRVSEAIISEFMKDWKPYLECTCDSTTIARCKQLAPAPLCLSVCLSLSESVSESPLPEGIPGEAGEWTLEDCRRAAEGKGIPEAMLSDFWAHYAAVNWIDAAGRKITNLKAALAKWKANQSSRGKRGTDAAELSPGNIKTKLEAISARLDQIGESRDATKIEEARKLRERKRELQAALRE